MSANTQMIRLRGGDRMQWEADVGPVPQHVAAVVMLATPDDVTTAGVRSALVSRLLDEPSLRRRPVKVRGGGPWAWSEVDVDPDAHVVVSPVPAGTDDAVLDAVARLVCRRLDPRRPPWVAHVLVGPDGHPVAVALVLHHVLTDGVAGLALLGRLVDAEPRQPPADGAAASPPAGHRRGGAAADAWVRRWAVLNAVPRAARQVRAGWAEVGGSPLRAAPRTSLNARTGPRRELAALDVAWAALRTVARAYDASANDVLVTAVGSALGRVQAERGEHLESLVVSVPVAARHSALDRGDLGNAVGLVPLPVPTTGPFEERLRAVSTERRRRLAARHGSSLPLVLATFRTLSVLHLVGWYADHQRLVNTLVTTVRGPQRQVSLAGVPVRRLVPVVVNQGNVTVAFAALSYAGTLTVTVTADPDHGPAASRVAELLAAELLATELPAAELPAAGPARPSAG